MGEVDPRHPDQAWVDGKRAARMSAIDALPEAVRLLVHEYSYNVVRVLLDLGVTKPKHIRHVVETVLNEFSPTRGSYSRQGIRTEVDAPSSDSREGAE